MFDPTWGAPKLSQSKVNISSMNEWNVTDLMSDWSNNSTEYRMSALSIYILFLQLSLISILVTHHWLQDVVWSRDMIWDKIQMLRHGLSRLNVETQSEPRYETDKVSNIMRHKRDETQNTRDWKYIEQRTRNKTEMHANETRDSAEMHSLVGTIWLYFQHSRSVIFWLPVQCIPIMARKVLNGLGCRALVSLSATMSFVDT